MLLWLLLITSSQLLWDVTCPTTRNHAYKLAVKKAQTPKHQAFEQAHVHNKNQSIRRITRMDLITKVDEHRRQNEVDTDDPLDVMTTDPFATKPYWNLTHERCDYDRIRCMRAYATGAVCARTMFYRYYTFPNYCALDFHNCVERFAVWQLAYMGICTEIDIEKDFYVDLPYDKMTNTSFLQQMYVEDSGDITNVG